MSLRRLSQESDEELERLKERLLAKMKKAKSLTEVHSDNGQGHKARSSCSSPESTSASSLWRNRRRTRSSSSSGGGGGSGKVHRESSPAQLGSKARKRHRTVRKSKKKEKDSRSGHSHKSKRDTPRPDPSDTTGSSQSGSRPSAFRGKLDSSSSSGMSSIEYTNVKLEGTASLHSGSVGSLKRPDSSSSASASPDSWPGSYRSDSRAESARSNQLSKSETLQLHESESSSSSSLSSVGEEGRLPDSSSESSSDPSPSLQEVNPSGSKREAFEDQINLSSSDRSPVESSEGDDEPDPLDSSFGLLGRPENPPPVMEKKPNYYPAIEGCRGVDEFHRINRIEEGTYGVVYRAKDLRTGDMVAMKKLKMEREKEGFPITSLREVNTLMKCHHPNVVAVREIVVGNSLDKIYIVMDYVEHDLKSLMETMTQPFLLGEVKTLMLQLLNGVHHLHDNWILHRDIKASNLLLSHKGILKIGDFGLAREYGSPLKPYTQIVVTLWYRAPELLLGTKLYSTSIDIWSCGCVFSELLTKKPLFNGKSETEQIDKVFKELGTPNDKIWPGPPAFSELPIPKSTQLPQYPDCNMLRRRYGTNLTEKGYHLLLKLLTYDPVQRISAKDAMEHEYFKESPLPVPSELFPTWPAKSEGVTRRNASPKAPEGGAVYASQLADDQSLFSSLGHKSDLPKGAGFTLKF